MLALNWNHHCQREADGDGRYKSFFFWLDTYHKYFFVAFVHSVVIDHADNGHTQIAPNAKRDAESQAGQDCNDVPPGQTKAGTVHHWQLLLLHQLRTAFCW